MTTLRIFLPPAEAAGFAPPDAACSDFAEAGGADAESLFGGCAFAGESLGAAANARSASASSTFD